MEGNQHLDATKSHSLCFRPEPHRATLKLIWQSDLRVIV